MVAKLVQIFTKKNLTWVNPYYKSWCESGDLSRLYFSLCQKRGENSDFPICADLGSVWVARSSKFADFRISLLHTWICTPFSANFTNFAVLKNFDRQTFTKKRTFHQITGISDLNHLVHIAIICLAELLEWYLDRLSNPRAGQNHNFSKKSHQWRHVRVTFESFFEFSCEFSPAFLVGNFDAVW